MGKSKIHTMAQHYSFPTLDEQEVIDVFAELQIPLTKESLTKPPQGFMRDLYERCLSMLTGIRREAITCRNLTATQCLSDPGLYDDTIPEIQFFRELRGLMETVGIIDFSRRDIDKPVKERTIRILSAVINFAKFRLDKMDQIEEFEEQLENLLEDRQVLVEGNGQAVLAIDRSNSEREEVRPQVEAMERETLKTQRPCSGCPRSRTPWRGKGGKQFQLTLSPFCSFACAYRGKPCGPCSQGWPCGTCQA